MYLNGFSTFKSFEQSCFPSRIVSSLGGMTGESGYGSLFLILANIPALFSINEPDPKLNLIVEIFPLKLG